MSATRGMALGTALGLLALFAWYNGYLDWVPVMAPSGPVDHVAVVWESGDATPEQAAVLTGGVSRELRAVGKWRLWDEDDVPEPMEAVVRELIEGKRLPQVMLFRGGEVWVGPLPLPATDGELRAMLEKHGGF